MKTRKVSRLWVLVAVAVLFASSLACDGPDTDNEPRIDVGDDTASEIVEDVRDAGEAVEEGFDIINGLNCAMELDSCIGVEQ